MSGATEILLIGGTGCVGSHIRAALVAAGVKHVATGFSARAAGPCAPLDVRSWSEVGELFARVRPRTVILAAGLAGERFSALSPGESLVTHVHGTRHVVLEARRCQSRLVFFSSQEVFPSSREALAEDDAASPRTELGRQKLACEHFIATQMQDFRIIRTGDIFSATAHNGNFLAAPLAALRAGRRHALPGDILTNPISADALAQTALALLERGAPGVYHVGGGESISPFEFARQAAAWLELDAALLDPVAAADHPAWRQRPFGHLLQISKTESALGQRMPSYRQFERLAQVANQSANQVAIRERHGA